MNRCLVVTEHAGTFPACCPDLPGRVATGATREEAGERMREAVAVHLEGLREDGLPVPETQASALSIAV